MATVAFTIPSSIYAFKQFDEYVEVEITQKLAYLFPPSIK